MDPFFKDQDTIFKVPVFGDDFDEREWAFLMYDAYIVAKESPDPSTQNAALLWNPAGKLIASEWNRFPDGVEYLPERWERPLKYEVIEHAERNAIFLAAQAGRKTQDSTMVAPWAACSDCARAIIQAGVARLVRHRQCTEHANTVTAPGKDWSDTISTADQMLKEAGVEIIDLDATYNGKIEIRHCGAVWHP